ncbi:MAG: hypothetical protein A2Y64_03715 [Candidatus Coatesbacteria bacterium RBG_13_66_14]|uniref:Uncharacterized protein n=1 Tax=Candidatus Coatesbacteria bacterium RBG_13_66_14 TaxID=1817816 RepID=A0A1F5EWR6_9BACT|nr:MAG: hypothetical protein A2Y64_03715 [Candidatus Coatesbacteria bacterium RBG_13_66_14]
MLTLKRGEAAPEAVARFYFNGRDDYDTETLHRSPDELKTFLEELARGLRDQIELTAGSDVEFISGPDYREEPYLAAGYSYRSALGADRYYNRDTVFYVGGRYAFLDLSCYADLEGKLAGELEALLDSARIEPEKPTILKLKPGQGLDFGNITLTVPGEGWTAEETTEYMLLSRDGLPLVDVYVRRPASGGAEGSDLSLGLKGEIDALYGEVEYLGPVEVRRTPVPYAAVSYRGEISGRAVWRRDAAVAVGDDYYFIDAGCPADSPDRTIEELTELVNSVGPREEK